MRNNNMTMKGATNVKSELGNREGYQEANEKDFNSKTAEVIRDESRWDAFQLIGDTNAEEMNHQSATINGKSSAEVKKILDRGLAFRMGRKIQMVLDAKAA